MVEILEIKNRIFLNDYNAKSKGLIKPHLSFAI